MGSVAASDVQSANLQHMHSSNRREMRLDTWQTKPIRHMEQTAFQVAMMNPTIAVNMAIAMIRAAMRLCAMKKRATRRS